MRLCVGQQFVQGGQQYVQRFQERIGVLSGSVLNYHFAVNNEYGGMGLFSY